MTQGLIIQLNVLLHVLLRLSWIAFSILSLAQLIQLPAPPVQIRSILKYLFKVNACGPNNRNSVLELLRHSKLEVIQSAIAPRVSVSCKREMLSLNTSSSKKLKCIEYKVFSYHIQTISSSFLLSGGANGGGGAAEARKTLCPGCAPVVELQWRWP